MVCFLMIEIGVIKVLVCNSRVRLCVFAGELILVIWKLCFNVD